MPTRETANVGKSFIRTFVPVIVGVILASLANVGIDLDEAALREVVYGLTSGGYYLFARMLEERIPALGWLLGYPSKPNYENRVKK